MTVKIETIEHLINLDKFKVDEKHAHIVIDKSICAANCQEKPCLYVCPAAVYKLEEGEMWADYAGCLECGTCRAVCTKGGLIQWEYPKGAFGVNFRQG